MSTTAEPTGASPDQGASAWIEIDDSAIESNVSAVIERAGAAEVMAIVKGDAYGHGLVPSAQAALRGGARWLGVAQLQEALALRAAGVRDPVLTWLYPPGADLGAAIDADLDLSVSAPWALYTAADAARARGRAARVHVKVDTGLARGGALDAGWAQLIAALGPVVAEGAIELIGLWSHLATADEPGSALIRAQTERFTAAATELERVGLAPSLRHLANSAATLTDPRTHFDLVRPGLAIYGLSPVPKLHSPTDFGLREAMRVRTRLALVKRARAGQGVSYGHHYVTDRDTVLGLVPMGYADGVPRHASGTGPVQIDGARHTVAGRVCMDQFMVDLGPEFAGAAGDEVTLIGPRVAGAPSAQDWADAAGTISYEIVTRLSGRLPRIRTAGR